LGRKKKKQQKAKQNNKTQHQTFVLVLCSSSKNLDLRLGFELCAEEKDFICKRKKVVAAALKNVLQLDEDLQEDEVCGTTA